MKKYILIASAALLALASCTKVQEQAAEPDEIGFVVANYVQTKAEFEGKDFGAYAWHNDAEQRITNKVRFANEKVAQKGGVWTTVYNTYYWMKTGSDDFVCYAPFDEGKPEVTPTSIDWGKATPYQVRMDVEKQADLMYADKVLNQTGAPAVNQAATPVPVLFHHALAMVSFKVRANFVEYTAPANQSKTTWEITLSSAKLSGIRDKGSLELKSPDAAGKWTLPEGKVWTPAEGSVLEPVELLPLDEQGKAQPLLFNVEKGVGPYELNDGKSFYVLPQALVKDAQKLEVVIHIKTTLPTGRILEEDYVKSLDLADVSYLKSWQMNQSIQYTIWIKPTAQDDETPTITPPEDPTDVTVTFDPALAGWEPENADVNIQL